MLALGKPLSPALKPALPHVHRGFNPCRNGGSSPFPFFLARKKYSQYPTNPLLEQIPCPALLSLFPGCPLPVREYLHRVQQ